MATMTLKQINDINGKCQNGFRFDLQSFVEKGEKGLVKEIVIQKDEKYIKVSLYWVDEIIKQKNEHQCLVPSFTRKVLPQVHVAVWHKKASVSFWGSSGLGEFHRFKDFPSNKRLMNELCKRTELVTDELVCSMLPEREREEFEKLFHQKSDESQSSEK